jgi:hypothetical protein
MDLINELNNWSINQNIRMCSFDITNMYTNTPLNTLTNIIRNTLSKEEVPQLIIFEIYDVCCTFSFSSRSPIQYNSPFKKVLRKVLDFMLQILLHC